MSNSRCSVWFWTDALRFLNKASKCGGCAAVAIFEAEGGAAGLITKQKYNDVIL